MSVLWLHSAAAPLQCSIAQLPASRCTAPAAAQEVRVPLPATAAAATAGLELVELFGGCLLTKAGGGPLQIRDLAAGSLRWALAEPNACRVMLGHCL